MCDCDQCCYDAITAENVSTNSETSSSKSHSSVNITLSQSQTDDVYSCSTTKSVHFKETVEIFLIPSRKELLTTIVSVCHTNMTVLTKASCLKHDLLAKNKEYLSLSPKKVSFNKFVTIFKIPSN